MDCTAAPKTALRSCVRTHVHDPFSQEGKTIPDSELVAHCKQSLPEYMVPTCYVALEAYPVTNSMKVDRARLPVPQAPVAAEAAPPIGPVEERIARIWCEVFNVKSVDRKMSFYATGVPMAVAAVSHGGDSGYQVPAKPCHSPTTAPTKTLIRQPPPPPPPSPRRSVIESGGGWDADKGSGQASTETRAETIETCQKKNKL